MGRLVDLSHAAEHGRYAYRDLPAPVTGDFMGREDSAEHCAEGTCFHIARIKMVGNTGTYLDSPFHRYAEGRDLAELPLEPLADLPDLTIQVTCRVSSPSQSTPSARH